MICIFSVSLLKKSLVDGILEIFCCYGGTTTSNSVLLEVCHILERLPQRVTSAYGTALTLPIVKMLPFQARHIVLRTFL